MLGDSALHHSATSEDPAERQQALDVARGLLLHAALTCAADDHDPNADLNPGAYSSVHEDMLYDAARVLVRVLHLRDLAAKAYPPADAPLVVRRTLLTEDSLT